MYVFALSCLTVQLPVRKSQICQIKTKLYNQLCKALKGFFVGQELSSGLFLEHYSGVPCELIYFVKKAQHGLWTLVPNMNYSI